MIKIALKAHYVVDNILNVGILVQVGMKKVEKSWKKLYTVLDCVPALYTVLDCVPALYTVLDCLPALYTVLDCLPALLLWNGYFIYLIIRLICQANIFMVCGLKRV